MSVRWLARAAFALMFAAAAVMIGFAGLASVAMSARARWCWACGTAAGAGPAGPPKPPGCLRRCDAEIGGSR